MSTDLSLQTVGGLVAERPSRSRIFERWGIDYCCGGKKPLKESCAALSVDLDAVLRELQVEGAEVDSAPTDLRTVPLSTLTAHIIAVHHASLRAALPRLSMLTQKVRDAHARRHPELTEVASVFAAFRSDMEAHTDREEQILFPYIEQLESENADPTIVGGSVHGTIQEMEKDHEDAGQALETLRRLTNGFTAPDGACATYRAMLDALSELEADTHRHVHKENSILFPRAEAREAELSARLQTHGTGR